MNTCSVPDCPKTIPAGKLLCYRHWDLLPEALRRRVTRTWLALLDKRGSRQAYEAARTEAINTAAAADRAGA
jgi:hypothetical protein